MGSILQLIQNDLRLELRNRTALFGLVLYVVSSLYLGYQAYGGRIEDSGWGALYWVVALFGAVQAALRSFQHEAGKRFPYYYWLVRPQDLVLAKMTYNALLMTAIHVLQLTLFVLWFGWPVVQATVFATGLLLGILGTSLVLTLTGAIAAKSGGNPTLMAVLSFPLLLPQLLIIAKVMALTYLNDSAALAMPLLGGLAGFCAVSFALAYLLFPYLWRD
jgi:heme exporter protein B